MRVCVRGNKLPVIIRPASLERLNVPAASQHFDSVVLQVEGDGVRVAEQVAESIGGVLEVMRSKPITPTKEQRKQWRDVTGKKYPNSAPFAALVHTETGQCIPLIRHGSGKGVQVHFHGLQQFRQDEHTLTEDAMYRTGALDMFLESWREPLTISQIDYCKDLHGQEWKSYANTRTHRSLCKREGTAGFNGTTVYYQPPKRTYVKVTAYDKTAKNKLAYPLVRVEYSAGRDYWRNTKVEKASEILSTALEKIDRYAERK
jgi:hypothetical protein